ncbi:MAG TPA: hypothetical protein VFP96_05545 [Candidatus Acidoferrum sp.]|nr:hypothetical protein [Candidatus Acidoferrum sp.]
MKKIARLKAAANLQVTTSKASLTSTLDHMRQVGQNSGKLK